MPYGMCKILTQKPVLTKILLQDDSKEVGAYCLRYLVHWRFHLIALDYNNEVTHFKLKISGSNSAELTHAIAGYSNNIYMLLQ